MSARILPVVAALLLCAFLRAEDAVEKSSFPDRPRIDVEPTAAQREEASHWIARLGSEEYAVRLEAQQKLRALGAPALKQLRAARESGDAEVRQAASSIVRDAETEVWEGYYYYSLEKFDDAVTNGTARVKFWFVVQRDDQGHFTAKSDEADESLGKAAIAGLIDRKTGELTFTKQYNEKAGHSWQYEGKWSSENGRIEGTYGPNNGGFVLYPRKLTSAEEAQFSARQP